MSLLDYQDHVDRGQTRPTENTDNSAPSRKMGALLRAGGSAGEVSGPHLRILSVRCVDKPNSQIEAPSRGLIKAMTKRALATCTSTQHHRCREGIDGGRRPYGLPAVGGHGSWPSARFRH